MKSLWLKACGAALAAVCLGGVSGMLRAQQTAAQRDADKSVREQARWALGVVGVSEVRRREP
jgi:hypothetical protein